MFAQLEEVLSGYPLDGLWLDIFNLAPSQRDCCCQWCTVKYHREVGGAITETLGSPEFQRWKATCLEEVLRGVADLRDRYRGGGRATFNGAGAGLRKHPYMGTEGLPL